MNKKKILIFFLIIMSANFVKSFASIFIVAKVGDDIITNYDISKEIGYLKILNPKIIQLNDEKISELAKNSLIKEIIKKKETMRNLNENYKNVPTERYLKDLILSLNLKNETELREKLILNNSYKIEKLKKKIEIELMWNELIYLKFRDQLNIDIEKIREKVSKMSNSIEKKFLLSEIVITKKKDISIEDYINQINSSINEIGFENTANVYSISDTSKLGGKIGWVDQRSLSVKILDELNKLEIGDHSKPIKLNNNFLILRVEDIQNNEIIVDQEKELKKIVNIETNKQLTKFSKIYFDKSRINYFVNEY